MQENPFAHLMPQQSAPARGQVFTLPKDPAKEAAAAAELRNKNLSSQEAELRLAKMQREAADAAEAANPAANASNLHGEDYLRTLPPGIAGQVKLIADGKLAVPSSRSKQWSSLIQHVFNYDPGFDQVDYNARFKTRQDFTSGASSKNIKALNTAIGHVGQLSSQIEGTASHGGFPLATTVNNLENWYNRGSGDAGITKFEQTAGAVASELTQVFRGTGGAEADVTRYLGELNSNASLAQKKAAIQNIAGLLNSRLQAIGDQYTKGMGTAAQPLQLLDEHAQKVMGAITGTPPASPPGTPPGAPPAAPGNGGPPPMAPPGGGGGTVNKSTMYYGGPGGSTSVATGATKSAPDLEANKVIDTMFKAGATPAAINAVLVRMGRTPMTPESFTAANTFRKQHHDYTGGYANYMTEAPTTADERTSAGGFDAFMAHAGNAASFGLGASDRHRADLSAMEGLNPTASTLGEVGGSGLTAGAMEAGATLAAAKLGVPAAMMPWVTRGSDAAFGAAQGASGNPESRGQGALLGALTSLAGGAAGRTAVRAGGNAMTGVRNEVVRSLTDRGIPLTVGQTLSQSGMFGKAVKGIEDRLTGIPVVGDAINARRTEGLRGFNRAAFDEGLTPINGTTNGVVGAPGIDMAQDVVDQGYRSALGGVNVTADAPFVTDMRAALNKGAALPEPMASRAGYTLNTRVGNSFDPSGNLSGNDFQQALRGLSGDASAVSSEPYGHDFGTVTNDARSALEGMLNRQAPGVLPAYKSANSAFRNEEILRGAVNRARNAPDELFTPAQLATEAAGNAKRFGNTQGTTQQPFYGLTRAGQAVLPSKVPDSGTAGRLATMALPATLGGGGAAAGYAGGNTQAGTEGGLTLGALLALGGTKAGQRLLVSMLLKRPDAAVKAGSQIYKMAPVGGIFGAGAAPALLPSAN